MKIEVDIRKSYFFMILGAILIIGAGIFAYAYNTNYNNLASQGVAFGHSADELVVQLTNGTLMTVQDLLKNGVSSGGSSYLGPWEVKAKGTYPGPVYQAATDGFVVAPTSSSGLISFYTDGNNLPTTVRVVSDGNGRPFLSVPVRKGDYWQMREDSGSPITALYWIPILNGGSATGSGTTFAGYTSIPFGAIGGMSQANAKCNSAFTGSRICTSSEIENVYTKNQLPDPRGSSAGYYRAFVFNIQSRNCNDFLSVDGYTASAVYFEPSTAVPRVDTFSSCSAPDIHIACCK